MPLTKEEREFLDAYVYEAMNEPFFSGRASTDLKRCGIDYTDVSWLLTAYDRELAAEGIIPFGRQNPNPPPSPWATLEEAKRRNEELRQEWEPRIRGKKEAIVTHAGAESGNS